MTDTSVQLQLLIGKSKPMPASQLVIDSLLNVEVENHDNARDGFQMTFTLGRDARANDYPLLQNRLVEPGHRVIIVVLMKGQSNILIDGIITRHQITTGRGPGSAQLVVTGEDISLKMDLEEKRRPHPNQTDSTIVSRILSAYTTYGITPQVTSTQDHPSESQRKPGQDGTDLDYIRKLAQRNGFIFYIEPTNVPKQTIAYWGPDRREGTAQPFLTANMGPHTNVESLDFDFDALLPAKPQINTLDVSKRTLAEVAIPPSLSKSITGEPATAWRTTLPADTARLTPAQAEMVALTHVMESADAVKFRGELHTVRYGHILRARRLVGVRGVGMNYNGNYYVKQVTHHISRGKYTQSFVLSREGRYPAKQTGVVG